MIGGEKNLRDRVSFSTLHLAIVPFRFCYLQEEGLTEGKGSRELRRQEGNKPLLGSIPDKDALTRKGCKAT